MSPMGVSGKGEMGPGDRCIPAQIIGMEPSPKESRAMVQIVLNDEELQVLQSVIAAAVVDLGEERLWDRQRRVSPWPSRTAPTSDRRAGPAGGRWSAGGTVSPRNGRCRVGAASAGPGIQAGSNSPINSSSFVELVEISRYTSTTPKLMVDFTG
jgi:hypothetical protein